MDSTNKAGNCRLAEYLDGVRGKLFPRNDCDPFSRRHISSKRCKKLANKNKCQEKWRRMKRHIAC